MAHNTRSIASAVVLAALCSPVNADQPSDPWLNARDYGASGSKFQTVAHSTAGSNQITVADPGDFQAGQGVMVSRCNAG